jgi:hypothetical protein
MAPRAPARPRRQLERIVHAAAEIAMDGPTAADKAFLARQLVQTTLPHTDPGEVPVWSRSNGNVTLLVQQGYKANGEGVGHPYGTIPRLLMYWMTTEAVRTKTPRLVLGDSLASFMEQLGLDSRGGGVRSDRVRLEQQMRRLFAARISFEGTLDEDGMSGEVVEYMPIARRTVFWWNTQDPSQKALWESYIELDSEFFSAITANPVPVDLRALRAIKRSPLALDLYSLLTYQAFRASKVGKPFFMTWKQMQTALGTSYAEHTDLKKAIKTALAKIQVVYPGLAIGGKDGGVEVLASSVPAIAAG